MQHALKGCHSFLCRAAAIINFENSINLEYDAKFGTIKWLDMPAVQVADLKQTTFSRNLDGARVLQRTCIEDASKQTQDFQILCHGCSIAVKRL